MLGVNAHDGVGFGGVAFEQVFKQLGHGAAAAGIDEVGRDFRERNEDEGALGEAGMRQLKAGLAEAEISEQEQVEIEGSRAVGQAARAVAAILGLDGEEAHEQGARGKAGAEGDDSVDEARLIVKAYGRGGVERGAGADLAEGGEGLQSRCKGGLRCATGTGKIGAEADVCGAH